jgi:hypothetical protein
LAGASSFDGVAAREGAAVVVVAPRVGRPINGFDGKIAAARMQRVAGYSMSLPE